MVYWAITGTGTISTCSRKRWISGLNRIDTPSSAATTAPRNTSTIASARFSMKLRGSGTA